MEQDETLKQKNVLKNNEPIAMGHVKSSEGKM